MNSYHGVLRHGGETWFFFFLTVFSCTKDNCTKGVIITLRLRANANELKPERFRSGSNRSVLHPAGLSVSKSAWIARNEAEVWGSVQSECVTEQRRGLRTCLLETIAHKWDNLYLTWRDLYSGANTQLSQDVGARWAGSEWFLALSGV